MYYILDWNKRTVILINSSLKVINQYIADNEYIAEHWIIAKALDYCSDEQVCHVCGKPAEGEDTCKCTCPTCGQTCFDDVTLSDHGKCYDCHHESLYDVI